MYFLKNPIQSNVYLHGFMVTGKSTIGCLLAEHSKMQYLDIDKVIMMRICKSINTIFCDEGEYYFRKLEAEFICLDHSKYSSVVAYGGGRIVQKELKNFGLLVTLFSSTKTILQRIQYNSNRPLLLKYKSIQELFLKRKLYYLKNNDAILETDSLSIKDILAYINYKKNYFVPLFVMR